MGIRDLLRKYKNRVDKSPCPPLKEKPKMYPQQQQKENSNGIKPIDINAPA